MRTDFYERYKAGSSEKFPNCENLLHHCCKQVKSSITDVFTNYLIVLSSDGHLKPIRECKFNLESLHRFVNIVITL